MLPAAWLDKLQAEEEASMGKSAERVDEAWLDDGAGGHVAVLTLRMEPGREIPGGGVQHQCRCVIGKVPADKRGERLFPAAGLITHTSIERA
jgi:hypothetical protein